MDQHCSRELSAHKVRTQTSHGIWKGNQQHLLLMAEAHDVLSTQTWAWDPLLGASAAIMIIITNNKHLLLACPPLRENWLGWMNAFNPYRTLRCTGLSPYLSFNFSSLSHLGPIMVQKKRTWNGGIPKAKAPKCHTGYLLEKCEGIWNCAVLSHPGDISSLGLLYSRGTSNPLASH